MNIRKIIKEEMDDGLDWIRNTIPTGLKEIEFLIPPDGVKASHLLTLMVDMFTSMFDGFDFKSMNGDDFLKIFNQLSPAMKVTILTYMLDHDHMDPLRDTLNTVRPYLKYIRKINRTDAKIRSITDLDHFVNPTGIT